MISLVVNSGYSFFSLRKSLVKYFLKKNNVTIYVPNNKKKIIKEINSQKLKVKINKFSHNKNNIFSLFYNSVNLLNKINNSKPNNNNFYIFGTYLNLLYGLISFFIISRKNIYVFTGLGSFFNSGNNLKIFFVKFFFNILLKQKKSHFVFYNINDRNFLVKKKLHIKTTIIPGSGIEVLNKNFIGKKKIKKKLKFVFFARLNSDKGILELIKAIKIVNKKGFINNFILKIYGLFDDNPTTIKKIKLINLIKEIKNCHFQEVDYKIKLTKIFSSAHVFILPSHREGLPKTVLEAMNYQTSLLLSNIPGHRNLINKKKLNGLYFEKNNEIDLSNKIIWIIKNKKKIKKFMLNSRYNLKHFSADKVNKKFYEISK